MNFFAFDIRKAAIIAFIVALPLLSINMQRNPGEEPWYKKPIAFAASLAQSGYSSFASGVRGTVSQYLKLVGIKKDIQSLQHENEELRAKLGALAELSLENQRLNKLLDFKQRTNMEIIGAKVIARELTPDNVSLRINRGLKHGLKKLQAVITVEGVVGYVYRPDVLTSQVLVLTDRSSAIDAIVQRTRASGLVSGKSRNVARLRYLERAGDVAVGDMIVTSGLQGYFPKGFPIGKITAVKKTEYGISQEAQVVPIVNPANVEEVFVVLNSGNEDFSERYGDPDFGPPFLSKINPLAGDIRKDAAPPKAKAGPAPTGAPASSPKDEPKEPPPNATEPIAACRPRDALKPVAIRPELGDEREASVRRQRPALLRGRPDFGDDADLPLVPDFRLLSGAGAMDLRDRVHRAVPPATGGRGRRVRVVDDRFDHDRHADGAHHDRGDRGRALRQVRQTAHLLARHRLFHDRLRRRRASVSYLSFDRLGGAGRTFARLARNRRLADRSPADLARGARAARGFLAVRSTDRREQPMEATAG